MIFRYCRHVATTLHAPTCAIPYCAAAGALEVLERIQAHTYTRSRLALSVCRTRRTHFMFAERAAKTRIVFVRYATIYINAVSAQLLLVMRCCHSGRLHSNINLLLILFVRACPMQARTFHLAFFCVGNIAAGFFWSFIRCHRTPYHVHLLPIGNPANQKKKNDVDSINKS